jgi:ribonuclease VapC
VSDSINDSVISAVTYCEVIGKLVDAGFSDFEARSIVEYLKIEIVDFDEHLAFDSGCLRRETKSFGLSLGDRSCLALARAKKATVLTADKNWSKLKIGVKITVIR